MAVMARKILPNLFDELILWKRRLEELNLISLLLKNFASSLIYVLQEQDFDVLGSERLEVLRIGDWDDATQSRAMAGGGVEGS